MRLDKNPYVQRWSEARRYEIRHDPQRGGWITWSQPIYDIAIKFHARNLSAPTKEMLGDLFEEIGRRDSEWEAMARYHVEKQTQELLDALSASQTKIRNLTLGLWVLLGLIVTILVILVRLWRHVQ